MRLPDHIHATFRSREGSDQIASLWALKGLHRWLVDNRPRRILEIGAGIGTLSMLLAVECRLAELIVCVEDDSWCRSQWGRNLGFLPPAMHLYDKVPLYEQPFPLIVLDGPQMPSDGWHLLARGGTVFVEGGRRQQRDEIKSFLSKAKRGWCEWSSRPPDRSKGYWLVLAEPEPWEWIWAGWRNACEGWLDLRARLAGRTVGKRRKNDD